MLCTKEIYHYTVTSKEHTKTTKNTSPPSLTRETSRTTATISLTSLTTSDASKLTIATSISPFPESEGYTAAKVGAGIAGVVLLFVVFLIICFLKRCRFQCIQSNQQQAKRDKVFNNTTYDDSVVKSTNKKQDVSFAKTTLENCYQVCNIDKIYLEKGEDYDHLQSSRQKNVTTQADDDIYGNVSYFGDSSYSSLRQNTNVYHLLDNEYSVISIH